MSQHGFVYLLSNPYMPDIFKVGCTERSPHQRASELSQPSGVPAPFDVVCYIEVANHQEAERWFHKVLGDYRLTTNREFFGYADSMWVIGLFKYYHHHAQDGLAFTDVCVVNFLAPNEVWELTDPWVKKESAKPSQEYVIEPTLKVVGGKETGAAGSA